MLIGRRKTGKLLSKIGKEFEASHVFLPDHDLETSGFNKYVQLRKATATGEKQRRREMSKLSF